MTRETRSFLQSIASLDWRISRLGWTWCSAWNARFCKFGRSFSLASLGMTVLACLLLAQYSSANQISSANHSAAPENDDDKSSSVTASKQPASDSPAADVLILVKGAAGTSEYAAEFDEWAERWQELATRQAWPSVQIHQSEGERTPKQLLESAIESHGTASRLWIVLLGHGTFARNNAKFNLVGPDVSAEELDQWLATVDSRIVVVNCASASGPFITKLAAEDRILVSATRSGSEYNYARFGEHMSAAVNDIEVDIDHDREISLLEAFLAASSRTQRFYRDESRLATEHALLNDNGDQLGTPAEFYRGIRPAKEAEDGQPVDGNTAARVILFSSPDNPVFSPELAGQRMQIEQQLAELRNRKQQLPRDEYFDRLEALLLELAQVYNRAEAASRQAGK